MRENRLFTRVRWLVLSAAFLASLHYGASGTLAAAITWGTPANPVDVIEANDLGIVGDDEVRITSTPDAVLGAPVGLVVGDTLTWTWCYKLVGGNPVQGPGYIVQSGDDADWDILVFDRAAADPAATAFVRVQFLDRAGVVVRERATFATPFAAGADFVFSANDVMGVLNAVGVIASVRIKLQITGGPPAGVAATINGIDFEWEAGTIVYACPPARLAGCVPDTSPISDSAVFQNETTTCFPEIDVPAASEWGLVVMTLMTLVGGTIICSKRRLGPDDDRAPET